LSAVVLAFTVGACDSAGTPAAPLAPRRDIITESAPNVTIGHESCAGTEVKVWANASGGAGGPYTYVWSGPTWSGDPRFFYGSSTTADTVTVIWTAGNSPGAKARLVVTIFVRDVLGDSTQEPFTIPCSV
jgi:hypothetical protein